MNPPRPKQSLSQELLDDLLRLLWQKFYAGDPGGDSVAAKCFAQDRSRLLGWVILWPARFMSGKGFTVTGARYKQIFSNIIMEAVRHGNTTRLGYRPAWLKTVLQSHFKKHWEEYYAEAKAVGIQAEHALLMLGKLQVRPEGDPVRTLAEAGALLARSKPVKRASDKPARKDQLSLL
jgi:hypothetical protein